MQNNAAPKNEPVELKPVIAPRYLHPTVYREGKTVQAKLLPHAEGVLVNFYYLNRANKVIYTLLDENKDLTERLGRALAANEKLVAEVERLQSAWETRNMIEQDILLQLRRSRDNPAALKEILQSISTKEQKHGTERSAA